MSNDQEQREDEELATQGDSLDEAIANQKIPGEESEPGDLIESPDADEPETDSDQPTDESGFNEEESTIPESDADTEGPFFDEDADAAPVIVSELEYQKARESRGSDDDEAECLEIANVAEARAIIEGFLFSSNEPVSVQKLSKLLNNLHPRTIRGLLLELQMEYDSRPGALQIVEIANGFQISTRPHLAPWMFRLHKHRRRSALSPATLETLAIVAYRQPMTKTEIEAIRGVESGAALRTLQDLNIVEVSGRREVIGRPQLYATTDQFLKVFGLRSLADLPSIAELRAQFAEEQKLKRKTAREIEDSHTETGAEAEAIDAGQASGVEESDLLGENAQTDSLNQNTQSDPGDQPNAADPLSQTDHSNQTEQPDELDQLIQSSTSDPSIPPPSDPESHEQ
jgi:segregation and condensation protein B